MMTFTVGTGKVHSLAFAPAGDRLAVGTGACCVHLVGWPDTDNRAELRRLQSGGAVAKHLAFDPPGTRIAAAYSDGLLVEWPAEMRPAVGPALPTYRAFFPCLGLWQDDRHGWVWPVFRMHEIGVWILAGESGLAEFPERERLEQVWTNAEGGLISRSANELAIWCYAAPEDPGAAWSQIHNQVRYPLDAVKFPQLRLIDRFPLCGGPWVCAARRPRWCSPTGSSSSAASTGGRGPNSRAGGSRWK